MTKIMEQKTEVLQGVGVEIDGRQDTSLQNINDALDQEFEKQPMTTIMEQKTEVLQGVGKVLQGQMSKKLGITTMKELANFKPAKYARALVVLADYETAGFESKTTPNDAIPKSTFGQLLDKKNNISR